MPIAQYSQLKPGTIVSIVLKADQRTGRQVQGTVAQLLTRHNYPRGIKVKLTDGRVGRVDRILQTGQQAHTMSHNNNPWASETSQGTNNPFQQPHQQQQSQHPPQQPYQGSGAATGYYSTPNPQTQPLYQQSRPSYAQQNPPGSGGPQRSDTETLLAQEANRGEQFEHMQRYEANAPQSEDDKNQAQLQKEYPNIDSSLIAAIYNERKPDMAEVRELLQELNTS